jgi:hypothetical protein
MSDNDDLIRVDEIEPINATPEHPLKADTDLTRAVQEGSGLTEADIDEDLPAGGDTDIPDLPDEEDIDGLEPPSPGKVARRIERMTRMQVFDYVLHVGAVVFEDGHELISCPGCSHDAICALRPTEHQVTGNTVMVCTGPTMEAKHRLLFSTKFEAGSVRSGCPHHPDTRLELPDGIKELRKPPSQRERQQIDELLKDEYSR